MLFIASVLIARVHFATNVFGEPDC